MYTVIQSIPKPAFDQSIFVRHDPARLKFLEEYLDRIHLRLL